MVLRVKMEVEDRCFICKAQPGDGSADEACGNLHVAVVSAAMLRKIKKEEE